LASLEDDIVTIFSRLVFDENVLVESEVGVAGASGHHVVTLIGHDSGCELEVIGEGILDIAAKVINRNEPHVERDRDTHSSLDGHWRGWSVSIVQEELEGDVSGEHSWLKRVSNHRPRWVVGDQVGNFFVIFKLDRKTCNGLAVDRVVIFRTLDDQGSSAGVG